MLQAFLQTQDIARGRRFGPMKASRVLVYRLGSLGDMVVALPAIHLIARAFPDAERAMLTNVPINLKAAPAQSVLENSALIHSYLTYPIKLRAPREIIRLLAMIRAWNADVFVYLASVRSPQLVLRDAAFFALCGFRKTIGLPLSRDLRSNRTLPGATFESEGARLTRCVASLGDAQIDASESWDLHLDNAELAVGIDLIRNWSNGSNFVVSGLGTKIQVKDWGADNWKITLSRLSGRFPTLGLAAIGSDDEFQLAEAVGAGWRGPFINLCGRLTPRESASVMRHAAMYIGHDTGPMHLAAAVGLPCVAVFSARERPGVWFPQGAAHRVLYHSVPCSNCKLEVCTTHAKICIRSISPDEVYAAAESLLTTTTRLDALSVA